MLGGSRSASQRLDYRFRRLRHLGSGVALIKSIRVARSAVAVADGLAAVFDSEILTPALRQPSLAFGASDLRGAP